MSNNPIKYQDLLVPDDSFSNAIKQLKELNDQYDAQIDKLKKQASEVAKNLQTVSGATKEQQDQIKSASEESAKLAKLQAQAEKEQANVQLQLQKVETERLKQMKLLNQTREKEKLTIEEAIALSEKDVQSITEANNVNKKLRQVVRDLTDAEDKEGKIRQQLNSAILVNTSYIKRNSDAVVQQKMNIGNYTESIKEAYFQLKSGNNTLKNMGIIASSTAKILNSQLVGGVQQVTAGVGNMIKGWVGAQAVLKGITKLFDSIKTGVGTIVEFQAANSKLAAILGTTTEGIQKLRDDALRLGSATAYTASQVTDLQTELAKLGFNQTEILQATSSILKFATAVGTDLASAAQVAGAAVRAFGADTSETQKYVATMAVATTKSALSFSDLQSNLSTIAPVAKAFGFTIEDTVTLFGALKNAGFDASSAATATRNIFLNLADSSGKLAKALGQPINNLSDMATAFAKLRDKGIDLATALELTDKRSVAAFESFMTQADGLVELRNSVTDAEQELNNMANTMSDNVAGSVKKMQSAWEGLMLSFSNSTGVMKTVIDFLTRGINSITYEWSDLEGKNKILADNAVALADATMAETNAVTARLNQVKDAYNRYVADGMSASEAAVKAKQEQIDALTSEIDKENKLYDEERKKQQAEEERYHNASLWKQALFLEKTNSQYQKSLKQSGETLARINAQRYQAEAKLRAVQNLDLGETKTTPTKTTTTTKPDKGAQQKENKNIAITKELYAAQNAVIKDSMEKERKTLQDAYDVQVAELENKLKNDKDLTAESRDNIAQIIMFKSEKLVEDLEALESKARQQDLAQQQQALNLRLAAVQSGTMEEQQLRLQLIENARQQELEKNSQLTEKQRQDEAAINAKYDKQRLDSENKFYYEKEMLDFDNQQALAQSEFDLLKSTEAEKTRYRLQAEKERLEKILSLVQSGAKKMSDAEIEVLQNTIAKINKEIETSKKDEKTQDIYSLFGLKLDDKQKEAINTSTSFALEQLSSIMDAEVELAEAAVEAYEKKVDAAQDALTAELTARANGYAANVAAAQKELELQKKNLEKAQKQQEKAQKAQAAVQTVQQIGDMVTASALIWSQLGFPWAIPAIGVMWASFAAAKIKAAQVAKQTEQYGEGTVELLEGGSHQSGNDIDLGTKKDGTKRRAEGGEFFAVINKRSSRKYRKVIPDVINALNNGTFANKYMNAYNGDGLTVNVAGNSPDLRELSADVRTIREQNARRTYVDGNGNTVETYKNVKRTIKMA